MRRAGAPDAWDRNVSTFYPYRACSYLFFTAPVWVIFLQQRRRLTLAEVALVDAVFWAANAASEIPTGAVADTLGRRTSLAVGVVVGTAGILLFGFAASLPLLVAANVLRGVALGFLSGAEEALLYDSLRAAGREGDYPRVAGRALALLHGSWAAGSLAGGLLGAVDLVWPFAAMTALGPVRLALVLRLREPPREERSRERYADAVRGAVRALREGASLRRAVVYASVLPLASFLVAFVFLQPYAVAAGVPIAALGPLVMLNRGAAMAGSASAHRILARVREDVWLLAAPALGVVGLVALAARPSVLALVLFAAVTFVTVATRPLIEGLILRESPAAVRATVMSAQTLLFTLLVVAAEPVLGHLADRAGMAGVMLALAAATGAALFPAAAMRARGTRRAAAGSAAG